MVQILLLCGYRSSGKDFFISQSLLGFMNWSIYTSSEKKELAKEIYKPRSRLSLLDSTKLTISKNIGIPLPLSKLDHIKDNIKVGGKILRDYFHEELSKKMLKDRFVAEKEIFCGLEADLDYVVADWKMMNTMEYLNSRALEYITCRVFREDGPLPEKTEKVEHLLDTFTTDIVLIPNENEASHLNSLVKMFPQYINYVKANFE